MKVQFIFKVIPVFIFYSDFLLKSWMAGRSFGIFVIVRKKESTTTPRVTAHEITHSKQYYRYTGLTVILTMILDYYSGSSMQYVWAFVPFMFPLAFLLISRFRYDMEIEAYRVHLTYFSLSHRDHARMNFAGSLAANYKLKGYTVDKIYIDLV